MKTPKRENETSRDGAGNKETTNKKQSLFNFKSKLNCFRILIYRKCGLINGYRSHENESCAYFIVY